MSSNQRPDTLMQDRIRQIDETSCNARPDHTFGSKGEELTVRPAAPWTPLVLIFSIPAIVVAFISSTHEDFTLGEVCVISAFMGTSSAFPVTGRVIGASFQRPKRSKV